MRYLADRAVRLRVEDVVDHDAVTKVEVGGSVASRQGINLPNVRPLKQLADALGPAFGISGSLDLGAAERACSLSSLNVWSLGVPSPRGTTGRQRSTLGSRW